MKNLIFCTRLVVILIALTTSSCEKDKTPEELLIGKWEIQFLHKIAYVDDIFLGDTTIYYDPGDAWIKFNDDKTGGTYFFGPGPNDFKWSVNGDNITINFTTGDKNTVVLTFAVSETTLSWVATPIEEAYINNPSKTYREHWYHWARRK